MSDETTASKALHREVSHQIELQSTGLEFCEAVIAKVRRLRVRIVAPPISYERRTSTERNTRGRRGGGEAAWTLPGCHFQR